MDTRIDLKRLLSGETDTLPICLTVEPSALGEMSDVTFEKTFDLHGEITNRAGYMCLTLDAEVPYETVCARCLTALSIVHPLHLEKTVAEAVSLENAEAEEIIDDYLFMEDGKLDLVPAVVEQILLELPMRHLCREDCKGLCPLCGHNRNEGECSCHEETVNPQFAALRDKLPPAND